MDRTQIFFYIMVALILYICLKIYKESNIENNPNDYANETMNNPTYPLELFQRVITVSLETMKIVKSLPKLDID